jgi:hypothetical protein
LVILVCPITRHLLPCCTNHEKGTEEEKEIEGKRILKELGHLRRELKGRLLRKGYDNVRMIDPMELNSAASSVSAARALMQDMHHMTRIGYSRLAEDIKELTHSWMLSRKRKESGSDRPDAKRAKLDLIGVGDGQRAVGRGGNRGVGSRRGVTPLQGGGGQKKSGAGRGVGTRRGDCSLVGSRMGREGGGFGKRSISRNVGSHRGGGTSQDKRKMDYGEF